MCIRSCWAGPPGKGLWVWVVKADLPAPRPHTHTPLGPVSINTGLSRLSRPLPWSSGLPMPVGLDKLPRTEDECSPRYLLQECQPMGGIGEDLLNEAVTSLFLVLLR